ncbi:hypothetical protein RUND412_004178 [Rhizina undulata]
MEAFFTFSFAKRKDSGDSVWIHPLMHAWAREHTNHSTQLQNVEDTITLVAASIVKNEHKRRTEDWLFERRILSHLTVCQKFISEFSNKLDSIKAADALSSIVSAYENIGFIGQAEYFFQCAITRYEMALGKDHPSSLDTLHRLGYIFFTQHRLDEALQVCRRALSGKEKAFGKDDLSTLCTLDLMALVFDRKSQYDEGLELHYRTLAGREKALGSEHRETLDTVNNIANVFYSQERYHEALEWYQRSLTGKEKALGNDHPKTLNTVHIIAGVFYHQERYDEALEWYRRLLAGK